MTKQISTYGALLLTAMVIIRAATIEQNLDVSSLYQRSADESYIENNIVLRDSYNELLPSPNLLLADLRETNPVAPLQHILKQPVSYHTTEEERLNQTAVSELDSPIESVLNPEVLSLEITETEIGLDRESTINSNLSLLFPRQRINPKPSLNGSQE